MAQTPSPPAEDPPGLLSGWVESARYSRQSIHTIDSHVFYSYCLNTTRLLCLCENNVFPGGVLVLHRTAQLNVWQHCFVVQCVVLYCGVIPVVYIHLVLGCVMWCHLLRIAMLCLVQNMNVHLLVRQTCVYFTGRPALKLRRRVNQCGPLLGFTTKRTSSLITIHTWIGSSITTEHCKPERSADPVPGSRERTSVSILSL